MPITLTWQGIITAGAVVAALTTMVTLLVKFIRWVDKQKKQDSDIVDLREKHNSDISDIRKELALLVYAQLASLKGLQEQGCNGPVTEAVNKLEKHINMMAHQEV